MTNFTVLTDEQAAHDAATSKRHLEALRETQAENARLRAHIQEAQQACEIIAPKVHAFDPMSVVLGQWHLETTVRQVFYVLAKRHLAALGETK